MEESVAYSVITLFPELVFLLLLNLLHCDLTVPCTGISDGVFKYMI